MRQWFIPGCILLLGILSILILRSVAPSTAVRQLIGVGLGMATFFVVSRQHPARLLSWTYVAYGALCLLLVIPLLIGETTRGIAAWIAIGDFFVIQPSQVAVPIVAAVVAQFLSQHSLQNWGNVLKVAGLIVVPGVLIALEPDLGTLIVYLLSLGAMVFMSDVPWTVIGGTAALAVVSMVLSWQFILQPYQKDRLTSFVASDLDTQGASYNARQAQIAVGSGQLVGRGLGQGVQSHLRFLPERQTDFVFASLAEELGFVGGSFVLALYAALISYIWLGARSLGTTGRFFAYSVMAMMSVQVLINVGMNMGLVPITGITLPFLSYGSSSFIGMCLLLALVQSFQSARSGGSRFHIS